MVVFLIVSPAVGVFFPTPQHVGGMGSASLEEYLGAYYETTRPYVELVPANDHNDAHGRRTAALGAIPWG